MLWLALAASFLLGSIPTALWMGRAVAGIDLREHGSGNLGATNVYRVLGRTWGLVVLLLDGAKGAAGVLVARAITGEASVEWSGLVGLLGAVLGHMFTPFASWRGGKGVATAAGAWLALSPLALAATLGVWAFVFAVRRIVSVASVSAALVLPLAVALLSPRPFSVRQPVFLLSVLTAALLLVRHRSNFIRMSRGEEAALDLRGGTSPPARSHPGREGKS